MSMVEEAKSLLEDISRGVSDIKTKHGERIEKLEQRLDEFERDQARERIFGSAQRGSPESKPEMWLDARSARPVPVFSADQKVSAWAYKQARESGESPSSDSSFARVLRGCVLGSHAPDAGALAEERRALGISTDPGGGYLIPSLVASEFVDLLRARLVLNAAGIRTIPIDGAEVGIAKLASDPTCGWHVENSQIVPSDPSFAKMALRPKTLVCLVRVSLELMQDAINLEKVLTNTLANAMAAEVDRAGLVGTGVNMPIGVINTEGVTRITGVGTPSDWDFVLDALGQLQANNVALETVSALIGPPALWRRMTGLKTGISGDKTSLVPPEPVAMRPRLFTTSCPQDKAVIGDWRDFVMGIRQELRIRILNEAFLGSNLQVGIIAYMRVDFAALRPQSFAVIEGITYS